MGVARRKLPKAQLKSDRTIGTWLIVGYMVAFLTAAWLAEFGGATAVALVLVAIIPATLPIGLVWAMSRRHKDLGKRIAAHKGLICPDCEYPLDHRDSDRCPECGRVAADGEVRESWADAGLYEPQADSRGEDGSAIR